MCVCVCVRGNGRFKGVLDILHAANSSDETEKHCKLRSGVYMFTTAKQLSECARPMVTIVICRLQGTRRSHKRKMQFDMHDRSYASRISRSDAILI